MSLIRELKTSLQEEIKSAIETAKQLEVTDLPPIKLETPRNEDHGDYATNIAMVLAGQAKMPPREIAQLIIDNLTELDFIAKTEVAGPGFINFYFSTAWLYDVVAEIEEQADNYGQIDLGADEKVQVEFVSANPTGPLHVGHSRGAVVGDVLANILQTAGFDVSKEYYINDAGNQMDLLGNSVAIRYQQLLGVDIELPEDAYRGEYITELARQIVDQDGDSYLSAAKDGQLEHFREYAYQKLLERIKIDLNNFGIEFDNWFSERSLHPDKIEEVTDKLQAEQLIYEQDGALWFKSSKFGDDKDRVVIKEDGTPTYLAADIAYHQDKYQRGFAEVINVWGADHHGYVERMKAVVEALGYQREALQIILVQLVTLLRDGKQVPMSKRAGDFVTMRDVIKEVGKDAARYFYVMRSPDSHFDFDLELAKEESTENPVYYIQYAHARICSILEQVKEEGVEVDSLEEIDLAKLTTEAEINLLKELADYPEQIAKSAESRAPHHMARFAYQLASAFHTFYNKCYVLVEDQELLKARLRLVLATKQVLVNLLSLLGLSAPENM
ncbi:arginine--tRNA ligase [Natroniella sulfidigena]|uniref:arginine--tRNA ligase n=1 Tax=Natroniella sulfidigena TaxID=723921 RepID=UPI00200A4BFD|nr:arginine--tRNA ligase [Natroniella sulfidigena]MCK8816421.1 arginine--tRNA ligase [Natroniella sulfidigena]